MKAGKFIISLFLIFSCMICNTKAEENWDYYDKNHAVVELDRLIEEGNIVVYEDELTKVEIDIEFTNNGQSRISGNDGWSSGYLPSGNFTLTPHITNKSYVSEISYKVNVSTYPVTINSVYSPYILFLGVNLVSNNCSIINSTASSSRNAIASLSWTYNFIEYGIGLSSGTGYLNCNINQRGQVMLDWNI